MAVSIRLKIRALLLAPLGVLANRKFFRSITKGFMLRSALFAWADSVSAAPKSALGKALHYFKEQRSYLLRYLEDGQLELTGWVQNENDGTVTAELEGQESCINEFLRAMQAISRFDITEIQSQKLPLSGSETSFRALY